MREDSRSARPGSCLVERAPLLIPKVSLEAVTKDSPPNGRKSQTTRPPTRLGSYVKLMPAGVIVKGRPRRQGEGKNNVADRTTWRTRFRGVFFAFVFLGVAIAASTAHAQPAAGAPGSPSGTVTVNGQVLPPPPVPPPKDAPNVLLIMTDDVGFAAPSTFGGVIPTPSLDRIANAGLRYTQFHTTALCSPTRAALI